MSIKVSAAVWDYSSAKGSELLVLLYIADCCNHDGTGAWPSLGRIARYTRLGERQVRRIIETLEASGELEVEHRRGASRSNIYVIRLDRLGRKQDKMSTLETGHPSPLSVSPVAGQSGHLDASKVDIAMSDDPSYVDPSKNHQDDPCDAPRVATLFAREWRDVLEELTGSLSPLNFKLFVTPMEPLRIVGDTLIVRVPTSTAAKSGSQLAVPIERAVSNAFGRPMRVMFEKEES